MSGSEPVADAVFERIARRVAARSTRRSILGRASRFFLGVLGIELVAPILRDGRRADALQPPGCNFWKYCGADGILCASCSGGSDSSCPSGCHSHNEVWFACCGKPMVGPVLIAYLDCCTTGTPPSCSLSCGNDGCQVDPRVWCPAGENYCCSMALETIPPDC
ncbi:MAG: hypothetical protein HY000_34300 [Planctomycetes bacterium]|nr:hypothetical protein [Planctomycetota bacterium]